MRGDYDVTLRMIQVLFMNDKPPAWVNDGNNVIGDKDDGEEVYWGTWGKKWAETCGYKPDLFTGYNSMMCALSISV